MSRAQMRADINKMCKIICSGLFHDESWSPIYNLFNRLRTSGYDLTINKSEYQHDARGMMISKVWHFEIAVPQSKKPLYGYVCASGAGTNNDPLSKYDVVAYVS